MAEAEIEHSLCGVDPKNRTPVPKYSLQDFFPKRFRSSKHADWSEVAMRPAPW